jgi:anti-sigma B factor antagonist
MENESPDSAAVSVYKPELRKIDVMNVDAFQAALQSRLGEGARLVLDLGNVQFIDSSGLGKIVATLRSFRDRRGEMRICGVQPPVMVLFQMVKLMDIAGIDPDAEASARALRAAVGGAP